MKKEEMVIEFDDGTKGMLSMERIKGRVDVKAEYVDVRVYYYTEHVNNQWVVKRCNDGFCYDAVIIAEKATRKEAIAEIILDVRKNQVRTANTYIMETSTGRMFEVVATSEHLAKKCVRFKCGVSEENIIQSYTYLFELTELLLELKMKSYVKEIEKYLVMSNRYLLYKNKDPEKTILAFCKDIEYLTERIIADYFKGVENNDNC